MKNLNTSKKILKTLIGLTLAAFIIINAFAALQAYSCTHFTKDTHLLKPDTKLSNIEIIKMIITGVNVPKPPTKRFPNCKYEEISIETINNQTLCAWFMKTDSINKGLIIYFHGYGEEKSQMLDYAYQTLELGYDALLVDFLAAGCSDGYQSTIGYQEASNVKSAFDYAAHKLHKKNIYLTGFSMGAAAIIKAQHDYNMPVKGIIAEASYGSLYDTVRVRLKKAGIMSYPLAGMFTFWGGLSNGMNAFEMKPEEYAKEVDVPILIACGGKDQHIPQEETYRIYNNTKSKKKELVFYPESRHELYITKYPNEWKKNIQSFLINN